MTIEEFNQSLSSNLPPAGISDILQALWYDRKGNWSRAHELAQENHTRDGSRIHAYLHRKEGDLSNSNYWHNRAGTTMPEVSLEEEWQLLVTKYLGA